MPAFPRVLPSRSNMLCLVALTPLFSEQQIDDRDAGADSSCIRLSLALTRYQGSPTSPRPRLAENSAFSSYRVTTLAAMRTISK